MNPVPHMPYSITAVFLTRCKLEEGERTVAILGSDKVFGCWDVAQAAHARRAGDDYWEVVVCLSQGICVYWYWVVLDRHGNHCRTESTAVRRLIVAEDSLKVTAHWNERMEVRPIWKEGKRFCSQSSRSLTFQEKNYAGCSVQTRNPSPFGPKQKLVGLEDAPTSDTDSEEDGERHSLEPPVSQQEWKQEYLYRLSNSEFGQEVFDAQIEVDSKAVTVPAATSAEHDTPRSGGAD